MGYIKPRLAALVTYLSVKGRARKTKDCRGKGAGDREEKPDKNRKRKGISEKINNK